MSQGSYQDEDHFPQIQVGHMSPSEHQSFAEGNAWGQEFLVSEVEFQKKNEEIFGEI